MLNLGTETEEEIDHSPSKWGLLPRLGRNQCMKITFNLKYKKIIEESLLLLQW